MARKTIATKNCSFLVQIIGYVSTSLFIHAILTTTHVGASEPGMVLILGEESNFRDSNEPTLLEEFYIDTTEVT